MTEPRSPFDPTPQQDGGDESTRAIRAVNPDEVQAAPAQTSAPSWDQSATAAPSYGSAPAPSYDQGYGAAPSTPPTWNAAPHLGDGPNEDEKSKAFIGNLLSALIGWLGALIGWFMAKDGNGWAKRQCAKAFNFQLALIAIYVVAMIIGIALAAIGGSQDNPALFGVGMGLIYLVAFAVGIMSLVFGLMQAFKAKNGEEVKYPFGIKVLK